MPGVSYTTVREAVPRGVRQRALTVASKVRDRIAEVEREIAARRSDLATGTGESTGQGGLVIIEDGSPLADQIAANNFRHVN
jgi:hypothetical protein